MAQTHHAVRAVTIKKPIHKARHARVHAIHQAKAKPAHAVKHGPQHKAAPHQKAHH